ncbi:hypothetical protein GCM10027447_20360 [Glycomyces halotolerans]
MGSGDGATAIGGALSSEEVSAANELTRRWFASRADPPAAASGLGVWPLLSTLATGAAGETRGELLEAAGVDPDRAAAIAPALLEAAGSAPALGLALGVWAGPEITLRPDWVDRLPAAAVGSLTGDAAVDGPALDRWASRGTDGMIERMPLDVTDRIDLVLATALMVRTTWITEFTDVPMHFRSGPWARLGRCRALTGLIRDDVLRVGDEASVLTVPGRDDVDVLLGLGREDLAPREVMSSLIDAADDIGWGRSATDMAVGERGPGVRVHEVRESEPQRGPEVEVQAVRFSVSAETDLLEDAAALGLERASDRRRAEFDRLAVEPVFVSQAKQRCVATFSATGFEAAAVTATAMRLAGAFSMNHRHVRATVAFDRPFAYVARHRPSGLILVGGWVAEPELEPS